MTTFDSIVYFSLSFFFLLSLFKGFVREVFSLFGYLVGYVLAINYHNELAQFFQSMLTEEVLARIAGFTAIFIIVKIIIALIIFFTAKFFLGLLGRLIRKFVDSSKVLSIPDRLLGGLMGLIKGFIIIAIILFPLSLFENTYKNITKNSVLIPYFEKMVNIASKFSYDEKLIDKIPIDDIKIRLKKMGDLNKIKKEINKKKDGLLESVIGVDIKEESQEKHSDDDKNKLNELIDSFSNN